MNERWMNMSNSLKSIKSNKFRPIIEPWKDAHARDELINVIKTEGIKGITNQGWTRHGDISQGIINQGATDHGKIVSKQDVKN